MLEPILVEKTKRTHKPNHEYIPTFLDDLSSKFMSYLSNLYEEHIRTSCEFLRENTALMPVILLLQSKILIRFRITGGPEALPKNLLLKYANQRACRNRRVCEI
jgi:hypothetical protein